MNTITEVYALSPQESMQGLKKEITEKHTLVQNREGKVKLSLQNCIPTSPEELLKILLQSITEVVYQDQAGTGIARLPDRVLLGPVKNY